MTEILYSAVGFIVALSILVTIHEFGHFWVARRLGVKVLRFSVGFGRPLWIRHGKQDNTEYAIAAIPLGGYVKMLDENEAEVPEAERHRAFNRQSLFKRSLIVVAGPAANFLFAILAYWVVTMVGVEGLRPVVGQVQPASIAAAAGFKAGDELESVDGRPIRSWNEQRMYLFNRALGQDPVRFMVRSLDGGMHERVLDFSQMPVSQVDAVFLERGAGLIGYLPPLEPVVGEVQPGSPAEQAGLVAGDRLLWLDRQAVQRWEQVVQYVQARPEQAIALRVERDGALLDLSVTPETVTTAAGPAGRIGVLVQAPDIPPDMLVHLDYGPLEGLWRGIENTWLTSALTLRMLGKMLTLEVSTENLSGPLTIAQYAGQSARIGVDRFLLFLALVSISLGIINLLPIPVLDGGHLLYHLAEAIRRGPLPREVMLWGQQIGILLLIGLMGLAFYNDIIRLIQ